MVWHPGPENPASGEAIISWPHEGHFCLFLSTAGEVMMSWPQEGHWRRFLSTIGEVIASGPEREFLWLLFSGVGEDIRSRPQEGHFCWFSSTAAEDIISCPHDWHLFLFASTIGEVIASWLDELLFNLAIPKSSSVPAIRFLNIVILITLYLRLSKLSLLSVSHLKIFLSPIEEGTFWVTEYTMDPKPKRS